MCILNGQLDTQSNWLTNLNVISLHNADNSSETNYNGMCMTLEKVPLLHQNFFFSKAKQTRVRFTNLIILNLNYLFK